MIFYDIIWYKKSNSQQMVLISSEPLSRVRVLLGAPKSLIKGILAVLIIARIFIYDNKKIHKSEQLSGLWV